MKKSLHRVAMSLVLCALLGSVALAGGKSKQVTFTQDIKVGDTLVKKGVYVVTFDKKTNELTIRDGSKVVAKTTARTKAHKSAYPGYVLTARDQENNLMLSGVHLGGKLVMVGGETAAGATTVAAPATPQQ